MTSSCAVTAADSPWYLKQEICLRLLERTLADLADSVGYLRECRQDNDNDETTRRWLGLKHRIKNSHSACLVRGQRLSGPHPTMNCPPLSRTHQPGIRYAISGVQVGQKDPATVPEAPGKAPPRTLGAGYIGMRGGAEDLPRRQNQARNKRALYIERGGYADRQTEKGS